MQNRSRRDLCRMIEEKPYALRMLKESMELYREHKKESIGANATVGETLELSHIDGLIRNIEEKIKQQEDLAAIELEDLGFVSK